MSIVEKVRNTCSKFRSSVAWCDEEEAKLFARKIQPEDILSFVHSNEGLSTNRFDTEISFPTSADEVGFILVAHGLDFGSGFRYVLHKHRNGLGAWLTIRAGLVKMGQENPTCDSKWLVSLSIEDVQKFFDLQQEQLLPLAEQLHTSIHEIGSRLLATGFSTPGDFVMSHMTKSAENAVKCIVENFPLTFNDEYEIRGEQVCLYKKAQLVVSEINLLFRERFPDLFAYSDIDTLTAFVDNVVVAMLRMNAVVKCTEDLAKRINEG